MRFESYAQQLEDLILYCALKDVRGGYYIDVGANDPTISNVTKFFYDRGWHGVNIEPIPEICALLEEKRPRDINLCVGCGSKRSQSEMFGMPWGLSTFSTEVSDMNRERFPEQPKIKKIIMTLTEIYERYCNPPQDIHFCKIDVEGYEQEVLEGIKDWNMFRPWIFVMEDSNDKNGKPLHEKWEPILLKHEYIFVYQFGVNRYYVNLEKEHIIPGFRQIKKFVEQNEVVVFQMQKLNLNK